MCVAWTLSVGEFIAVALDPPAGSLMVQPSDVLVRDCD